MALPTVFNDAMVAGQASFDATITAAGGTPNVVNLINGTNSYNYTMNGTPGTVTITRPDGSPVSWAGNYSSGTVSLSGATISISPSSVPADPIPGFNSGVTFTFSTPVNALGFQVGDWATCCQYNTRPANIVTQYGVPAGGTGLWISFNGGTATLVANSTDPTGADNPGVAKTNSYTNFIGSIDDKGTFTSVTFFGDGFGEYLVIGGLLDFSILPIGSVSGGMFVPHAGSLSLGAATVMDALNGAAGTNPAMQAALTTAAALPTGQISPLLVRLTPMSGRGTQVAAYTNFDAILDAVDLRVSGLTLNSLVATAKRAPIFLAAVGTPSGLMDGMMEATDYTKTFWVRALGYDGRQGQNNGFAGFHTQAGGMAFGTDVDLGNRWVIGGAFSAARGTVDFADLRTGDNSSVSSTQLTGYTTRNFGKWYAHGTLGYAQHNFATNRNTTLTGVAHGDFRGEQWGTRIGAAMPIKLANATVTPAIGLDYSHLSVPNYMEFGAGAASLNVAAQTIERLRSRIGGRVSTELNSSSNLVFRPNLHLYWLHDFKSQTPQLSASFIGGGPAFMTPSQPLPQDTASLGAGLVMFNGRDFTSEIRYGLDLGHSYSGQSVSAMARWAL